MGLLLLISPLPTVAALLLALITYRYVIHPAFISSLARVPAGHWTAHVSPVWLFYLRWTGQENQTVYDLHMRYGKAIRLTPSVLSINCFDEGVKEIYLGGFPKTDFYRNGFMNYDTHNIFTFEDNPTHTARKRLISHTFSKSFVMASSTAHQAIRDIVYGRLIPLLDRAAQHGQSVEILELTCAYSMDSFVQWQFGRSLASNLVQNIHERRMYLDGFFGFAKYLFWMFYAPWALTISDFIGLSIIPQSTKDGWEATAKWNLDKCDQAAQLLTKNEEIGEADVPIVFAQAFKTMSQRQHSNLPATFLSKPGNFTGTDGPSQPYPARLEIASDMFAHNSAAHETSGNTLTYALFELSRNPQWQDRLREELKTLVPDLDFRHQSSSNDDNTTLPPPKTVDSLPILDAILLETLRLYPSVPGAQPRRIPKTCNLAGFNNLPANTTVQAYAYTLHRTPEIFPDPHSWRPERWLEANPEKLSTMKRWFWAFGSGGRMCIGSHFAIYSMKSALGAIYTNFYTSIHDHGDMSLGDAYIAGPRGHRLEILFSRVHHQHQQQQLEQ